ncbi:MAG: hypothetical protein VX733_15140 [Candidatus Latescibacterota bacterium]|nr:hypothetical protein [Candidatus Latescibacterota bacterium]
MIHRFLILATGILATGVANAETGLGGPVVEPIILESASGELVEGALDWTAGTLVVSGQAVASEKLTNPVQRRLMGFRAAKLVAYRNLLEVAGVVQVDSRTTVSMAMVASDSIRAQVEGLVRGARVVPGSRREDGGVYRIDLQIDLIGEFAHSVLLDSTALGLQAAGELPPDELPSGDSLLVFVPPVPYTGLVVDARGSDLKPSMSPRILDDSGRVIYSAAHVDRDYATQIGIVGYLRDLETAIAGDRVGGASGHPMIVDATNTAGLHNSDVVVTRDLGTRIRMANMEVDFLSQCRVLFVVGPKPELKKSETIESLLDTASLDSAAIDSLLLGTREPDFLDSLISVADSIKAAAAADSAETQELPQ